jgi:hypothetical protein
VWFIGKEGVPRRNELLVTPFDTKEEANRVLAGGHQAMPLLIVLLLLVLLFGGGGFYWSPSWAVALVLLVVLLWGWPSGWYRRGSP